MEIIQLSLSKGVYGLLKNHLKINKLSGYNKNKLEAELKSAKILPGKNIPEDVVAINTTVKILDIKTNETWTFDLVAPSEAKIQNNKVSILSPIGVALLGYSQGNEVEWEMPEDFRTYRIEQVSPFR